MTDRMGDRYYLTLECAHCMNENEEVYYAPSCEITDFKCEHCGGVNEIRQGFIAIKKT